MGKEKNLGKLKSRFEVGGGLINEYNYQQNQGAITEEEKNRFAAQQEQSALREGGEAASESQTEADRIAQLTAEAHQKAQKNLRKKEKQPGGSGAKKGGAKKGAGKKAAAKKSATSVKKSAKKSAKKSSGKKSGAKKVGGRGR